MVFDMAIMNENFSTNSVLSNSATLDSLTGSVSAMESGKSYLSQTIDFLTESNKEYTTAIKNLYRSILESSDQEVITESFADFGTAVKKIIDKFLAFIKSLFQRFITNLNSMVKSEKYLKKHANDFKKFSSIHEFDYTGYNFTIFNSDIPMANAESEFIDNIDVDTTTYTNMYTDDNTSDADKLSATIKSVEEKMKENYQKLIDKLNTNYYDELRAKIIGKDGITISESDFTNELFCIFRDGYSEKSSFTVDSSYVTSAYHRFDNYESTKRSIENTQREIETSYKNVKIELEKMVKTEGNGDSRILNFNSGNHNYMSDKYGATATLSAAQISSTMINQMELYKKAKINQVQQMSNIHALAFAAKLDAAKDMFNQDKAILYKALYRIQGIKKEG